jgi:hypothetical protein
MAELKTITDIKFFLKNAETTTAFSKSITPFSSTYPNSSFNDVAPTVNPSVNLIDLSDKYQIKDPTNIGAGVFDITSTILEDYNDDGIFITCHAGDMILSGASVDELLIVGTIISIADDNNSAVLETEPNISSGTYADIYVFSKYNEAKTFNFNDSFYMVIKNPNIVPSKHEGIVNIDTTANSPSALIFAYGNNRTANPTFFSLKKISKRLHYNQGLTDAELTSEENIPCRIDGISTYAEQTGAVVTTIPDSAIPLWSVYEVNPYLFTSTNFSKNTTYRLNVCNASTQLPMKAISQGSVIPTE